MRLTILFLIFVSVNISLLFSQVDLRLKSGEKITGIIESENAEKIIIRSLQNDSLIDISRKNVKYIKQLYATVNTINGNKIEGTMIISDKDKVVLRGKDKGDFEIAKKDILSIEYNRDLWESGYNITGLTLLTPGGLNIVFGRHIKNSGFRVEVGFFPGGADMMWGLQGNFLANLSMSREFESNVSFAAGYSHIPSTNYYSKPNNWTYGAFCIDFNFHGLFFEFGLSFGDGSFPNPQFLIQFGYLYRSID